MLNLNIPSLDDALFDLLISFGQSNQSSNQASSRFFLQWEEAVANEGVYSLAAQGLGAIAEEISTATNDRMTTIGLAYSLVNSSLFAHETLLALSMAKTYSERLSIYKETGVNIMTPLLTHMMLVLMRQKKTDETKKELGHIVENAIVKTFSNSNIIAKILGESNNAPATKTRRRGEVTQKEAANICDVKVFTIRAWDRGKHTPEGYPGRENAVTLKAWAGRKAEGKKLKALVTGATRYGDIDRVSHKAERKGGYR